MTLNDVGARIGVTRERVRQIEMEALTELQLGLTSVRQTVQRKRLRLRSPVASAGGRFLAAS